MTEIIKLALETAFPVLWVEGEISNFHRHSSGHLYFTLKDAKSQLRAVMFRFEARKIAFDLKDGLKVVCRGRINVYEPRGEYQIVVEVIEPKGKGALQLAFEQLKEKLRAEGLFDPGAQEDAPAPAPDDRHRHVAARGGHRRHPQDPGAALRPAPHPHLPGQGPGRRGGGGDRRGHRLPRVALPGIDVIIVGRGGGSIEDLWAFNEEQVARAIYRCPVPIISAVGHEVDFTIADFVADIRASTPSAAAEMVIEKEQAFEERITGLAERAARSVKYSLQERRNAIVALTHHRIFQGFKVKVLNLEQRVDELETRAWKVLRAEKQALAERQAVGPAGRPSGSGTGSARSSGRSGPAGRPCPRACTPSAR